MTRNGQDKFPSIKDQEDPESVEV